MDLIQEKAELRAEMRRVRASIEPSSRKAYEDDIAERLYRLPAVRNAKVIGVYQAVGSEVSVDDLVRALRLLDPMPIVAYPVVHGEGIMTFSAVEHGEKPEFLLNPAAVIHMDALPKERHIHANNIDLLLVPGIAFDESCHRLGQGGGYYDRLIPHLNPECLTVGIAFDEQICESIPTGVHDRRIDYVVTPTRIIQR